MWRMQVLLATAALALVASCGGDEGPGAVTRLPNDTFAIIDGTEDGRVKYPVIELWDMPVCTTVKLISNTPHGTRVRVFGKKANCSSVHYDVEILEGEKAGVRGWVREDFLRFENVTPVPD